MELSVPFETNNNDTHNRKIERYADLITDLETSGYNVNYYAVEIGSRGYYSKQNCSRFKSLFKSKVDMFKFSHIKENLIKISLASSFGIYHSKHKKNWCRHALVNFV